MNKINTSKKPLLTILTLTFAIALFLASCNSEQSQTVAVVEQPVISAPKISDPMPQRPGEEVGISVDVTSTGGAELSYIWAADGGEIVRGQGSPAITYRVPNEPGTYNVRLRVEWDGQSVEQVTTIKVESDSIPTLPPVPTDTPANTVSPAPTNTVQPSSTSEPTSTPVSPTQTPALTPTKEPPNIAVEFLNEVEILYFDGFESMGNWNTWNSATGHLVNGMFELTGQEDWNSGLVLNQRLKEGEGLILRFKTANNSDFESEFVFSTGVWETDTFRQFGVYNGRNPKADLFQGRNGLGFNNLYGNLSLKADTWYGLLMAIGEEGEFLAVIWDLEDPSQRVVYNEKIGDKWAGKTWEFVAKATDEETVYIDDFSRITFVAIK